MARAILKRKSAVTLPRRVTRGSKVAVSTSKVTANLRDAARRVRGAVVSVVDGIDTNGEIEVKRVGRRKVPAVEIIQKKVNSPARLSNRKRSETVPAVQKSKRPQYSKTSAVVKSKSKGQSTTRTATPRTRPVILQSTTPKVSDSKHYKARRNLVTNKKDVSPEPTVNASKVSDLGGKKRKKSEIEIVPEESSAKKRKSKKSALIPRPNVTEYLLDPTFEQALPIPFISPLAHSKLLVRAVLLNDLKLLQKLTQDLKSICSFNVPRCIQVNRSALSYAIENGNVAAMKILLTGSTTQKFASITPWLIEEEATGHGSRFQFGHALRNVTVGRGGKEGNAALLKDRFMVDVIPAFGCFHSGHWNEALEYGVSLPILEKMKALFKSSNDDFTVQLHNSIVFAVRKGHNVLAAKLVETALAKGGFGFNNLHMEALIRSKKVPLTPFKFQSVGKKTIGNYRITPLHCAAINPDPYCLSTLLNMSPLYTITDMNSWTLVHYTAACTGTAPLELLVSRGASTNQVNKEGDTPAHIAAALGRSKNLELILKAEAKNPMIHDADELNDDEAAKPKGKKKVGTDAFSVLRLNKKGCTPLHMACSAGKLGCVKVLLDSPLVDKDKPTPAQFDKLTPLMIAAGNGHLELVKHLIAAGAKLQLKDRRGNIALTHAVINGQGHIVSYLLRLGDNHLAKDSSGNTLVHYACGYGWYFNLKLLLEAGCCPNEANLWKLTPLAIAFCKGHIGIVEELLKEPRVNINAPIDAKGLTLLLQSVSSKPSSAMITRCKYLIEEQKSDCSVTDFENNNAIHYLVESEYKQLQNIKRLKERGWGWEDEIPAEDYTQQALELLVKNRISLETRNSSEDTPVSLAANYGCFQMVQKLVQQGASLSSQPNAAGDTLLHLLVDHLTDGELNVADFYNNCSRDPDALAAMKVMSQTFNQLGMTPLLRTLQQYAALSSEESVKKITEFIFFLVIKLGSDVNARVKDDQKTELAGNSVLHLAAGLNYAEDVLKIILSKKPNMDPINATFRTPLTVSILKRAQAATRILVENGADVNFISQNDDDKSMLLLEVSQPRNSFVLVSLFVSKGAVVKEIVDKKTGSSILHYVAKNPTASRAVDAIKALTSAGAVVNCQNKYFRTSLHLAITSRGGETDISYDVEDALIEAGASLNLRDLNGRIALHFAFLKIGKGKKNTATSFMDPIELVTLVTSAMKEANCGCDIELADELGQTPLHAAALRGATISASHLLGESSKPRELLNRPDKNENTPLALAVLSNHEGCALMLLQAGSNFVVNLNAGMVPTISEDSAASWIWKAVKGETELLDGENSRLAKYSILEEIVRKDWQGLLYLMLQKLTASGSEITAGIEAALRTRRFKLAAKLIDRVKNLGQLTTQNQSFLHTFAQHASPDCDREIQTRVLDTLVRKSVKVGAVDTKQSTALVYAAINWNSHLCLELTKMMNISQIRSLKPDSAGRTPFNALFWKPIPQDVDFPPSLKTWCESLLGNGVDGNVRCTYPIRVTPYPGIRYCRQDSNEASDFMFGAQYSPLIMAVIYGSKKVVNWLLTLPGININFPDSTGKTALMHAVRLNDIKMVKLLLNPSTYNFEKDTTPWNLDEGKGKKKSMVDRGTQNRPTSGVDLNALDKDGWSVVHHLVVPIGASTSLVYARSEIILKVLAEAGAQLDLKNELRLRETPFDMAVRHRKFPLADALRIRLRGGPGFGAFNLNRIEGTECDAFPQIHDDIITIPLISAEADSKQMLDKLKSQLEGDEDENLVEADSLSNFTSENSIVLMDESRNTPFDCLLTQVDLSYGVFGLYNFYKMQLIKQTKGPELIVLFTRWGRMGDTGQYQKTPFPTEAEAVAEFKKIFRSKSGNSWDDLATTQFVPQPKKYKLVILDKSKMNKVHPKFSEVVKINFEELEGAAKTRRTQLPQHVFQLMRKLCLEHRSKLFDSGQGDGEHLPFGQIACSTLQKAEEVLDKLDKLLTEEATTKNKSATTAPLGESILQLSEAYFTMIPLHGYALEKISPLSQFQELRKHQQLVRNFLHNEFAFQLLMAAQFNQETTNPFDYVYSTLATKLETLDESSEEAQVVLEYVYNTSSHPSRPFVDKIYRVQIPGGDERVSKLKIGNRHLLWHGTQTCNLISILNRGLQIAPLGYNFNGSLFGKGIYFSDMFDKSCKYASSLEVGQPKFALLCEVALGQIQDVETGYWVSQNEALLKKGNHSLKTSNSRYMPEPSADVFWKGRRMPLGQKSEQVLPDPDANHGLDYNEYIVFNPDQANIKYLVQFQGTFPDVKMTGLFA